jgi:hypothetical protein
VALGEERNQRKSSRYIVAWRKRHIGCYASEEDAARAYGCAGTRTIVVVACSVVNQVACLGRAGARFTIIDFQPVQASGITRSDHAIMTERLGSPQGLQRVHDSG